MMVVPYGESSPKKNPKNVNIYTFGPLCATICRQSNRGLIAVKQQFSESPNNHVTNDALIAILK